MKFIYFVGTAGSGKSTLVHAYKEWLDFNGIDSIVVNLDPGSDTTPYVADIDIREWIFLDEVMNEYGLGPNGAQIVAADLMAININKLTEALETYNVNYVLIDTPGQLELFAFRESSIRLVDALGKEDSMIVYTADPMLYHTINGFVSGSMLSNLVQYRLQLPMLNLLTKFDLLEENDAKRIISWFENADAAYGALLDNDREPLNVVGTELFKTLENLDSFGDIRTVSAKEGQGLEEIYAASQLIFFGGDDQETSDSNLEEI